MKRILAILAMAAAAQATAITYKYEYVTSTTVKLTDYSGAVPANLELPSKIDGKTVVGIGEEFMEDCLAIKSLKLPSTIRFVESEAFDGCANISTLTLNEGLESIDWDAFDGLRSLKKLVIPSTVTFIGEDAFSYSGLEYGAITGIQSIEIRGGNNAYYKVVGGMLYDVQRKLVIAACTNIENAKIPADCVAIGHEAFATCRKLKSVAFPSSLERIGGCAFDCCFALKTVDLSKTKLTSIANTAFVACTALTEVRFPATLKEVGAYLFAHATALKSVYYNGNAPKVNVNLGWGDEDIEDNAPHFPKGDIYVAHKGKIDFSKLEDVDYLFDTRLTGVTSYVKKGTSGWGAVPGKWQGCPTSYVTYTVKFDANGGTGTMKAQALTYGGKKALPANAFKRTNYHFKGWATTKGGSLKYTDKQVVADLSSKAGATVTLYAVWGLSTYKVKFDGNGATSGKMAAQSINVGAKKALTANAFKRTGYAFQGWAKKKTATKADYKDKASVKDLATKDGATVTLYAVWKANAYTVKFDANGGTGKMADLAMTYGKAKALTANAFKRANWTFLGWSTSETATKATYANKASVKNLKASGTVTLYAVWKRNTYSIKFDANGGTGTMKAQTAGCGVATKLSANAFKRAGFTFKGWATSKTATTAKYTNQKEVTNLAASGKSVTLYAVWWISATNVVGNYEGMAGLSYGHVEDDDCYGCATVKLDVTKTGAVSATVSMMGRNYSFSSDKPSLYRAADAAYIYNMKTKDGASLNLVLDTKLSGFDAKFLCFGDRCACTFMDSVYGEEFRVFLWKNGHGASGAIESDPVAKTHVANIKSLKKVYLKVGEGDGSGAYPLEKATSTTADVTLSIGADGFVTLSGRILGASVSGKSMLKIDDDSYYTICDFILPNVPSKGKISYLPIGFSPYEDGFKLSNDVWSDPDLLVFEL